MTPDERAIRDLVARWIEAIRAGDAETVLGPMTDVICDAHRREPFGKAVWDA